MTRQILKIMNYVQLRKSENTELCANLKKSCHKEWFFIFVAPSTVHCTLHRRVGCELGTSCSNPPLPPSTRALPSILWASHPHVLCDAFCWTMLHGHEREGAAVTKGKVLQFLQLHCTCTISRATKWIHIFVHQAAHQLYVFLEFGSNFCSTLSCVRMCMHTHKVKASRNSTWVSLQETRQSQVLRFLTTMSSSTSSAFWHQSHCFIGIFRL